MLRNAQYSRSECLELGGVPCSVSDGEFGGKVLKIFEKADCPIEENNIEDCHEKSKILNSKLNSTASLT